MSFTSSHAIATVVAASTLCLSPASTSTLMQALPPSETGPTTPPKAVTLAPGQPAPPIVIEEWLKGPPVERFEPGTIYVLEFWATWCGPCLAGIGHLTLLQREYASNGVVVVGITSKDSRNALPAVKEMVSLRGNGMAYSVAWDGSTITYKRYISAARVGGIPVSFVVGKDGIIEFIGHPHALELVLPKLVDGTWNRDRDLAEVREAERLGKAMEDLIRTKPAEAMTRFTELARRWPRYAEQFLGTRSEIERGMGDTDAWAKTLDQMEARALSADDFLSLRGLAARTLAHRSAPGMADRCLRVATAAVRLSGERDSLSLRLLAKVHHDLGNAAEAIRVMTKAVERSDASMKGRLQQELDAWTAEAGSAPPTPATKPTS
jgi:thiol-disulfide isomerase/thioredoxin